MQVNYAGRRRLSSSSSTTLGTVLRRNLRHLLVLGCRPRRSGKSLRSSRLSPPIGDSDHPIFRGSIRRLHEGAEGCSLSARAIFVDRWLKRPGAIRPTGMTARNSHEADGPTGLVPSPRRGRQVVASVSGHK
jgi:hypothetical protein